MTTRTHQAPDGEAVVRLHWPLEAPSAGHTKAASTALAELVRYLNHATLPTAMSGLSGPDLHGVVAALAQGVRRLPQLLSQLDVLADELSEDLSLYDDRHDRPGPDTAMDVAVILAEGKSAADQLGHLLDQAADAASHLGHGDSA